MTCLILAFLFYKHVKLKRKDVIFSLLERLTVANRDQEIHLTE
jgi:hypothetical protein